MARHHHRLRPLPAQPLPELARYVATLEEISSEPEMPDTSAFGISPLVEGETALHVKVLTEHPADELLGFVAPPDWTALVVVALGTNHAQGGRRVRLGVGIDRSGQIVGVVRDLATDAIDTTSGSTGEAQGRLTDVLCRAMGVATPPPRGRIDHLLHHLWLDRLLEELAGAPAERLTWSRASFLHPAGGLVLEGEEPAQLVESTRLLASALDWSSLRLGGVGAGAGPPAELADWFDDGSYCRWLLDSLPPAATLAADVVALAPPKVGDRISAVLEAGLGSRLIDPRLRGAS